MLTAEISAPAGVGSTGSTAVSPALSCTRVWPVDESAKQRWELASIVRMYECVTADSDQVRDRQTAVIDGRTYLIRGVQRWQPSRNGREPLLRLLLEWQP